MAIEQSEIYRVVRDLRPIVHDISRGSNSEIRWGGYSLDPFRVPPLIIHSRGRPDFGVDTNLFETELVKELMQARGEWLPKATLLPKGVSDGTFRVRLTRFKEKLGPFGNKLKSDRYSGLALERVRR